MQFSFGRRHFFYSLGCILGGAFVRASRSADASDDPSFPPFASPIPLPTSQPGIEEPFSVVTSTTILADLARQIGGERITVTSLLPANVDPHDYEPSPADVIALEDADLIVLHGLELDTWVDPLVEAAMTDAPVIVATSGIETLGSNDDHFSQGDPHVWFDPIRVTTMVANIERGLGSIDPNGAASYRARLQTYTTELEALDREIAARIELIPPDRRILVTNHDALAYYAERYGLTILGTIIPGLDSRTEPSAREIAKLIEEIRSAGVRVIFAENTVDPVLAESLASDAGIRVAPELYTDSLGSPDSGANTYIGLMQTDTRIIVENLRA